MSYTYGLRISILLLFYGFGMWTCSRSPHSSNIRSLDQAKVLRKWSLPLDSLPGIAGMYLISELNTEDLSIVVECFDPPSKKRHHYLLTLTDKIGLARLTSKPIDSYSCFFPNSNRYIHIQPSGDLLLIGNTETTGYDSLRTSNEYYFSFGLKPLIMNGRIFQQTVDASFELRDRRQNKLFFEHTKALAIIDSSLKIERFVGAYPPDYIDKGVYAYHLSPYLAGSNGIIYMSFPGSSFVGWFDPFKDNTVFSKFFSEFEVDYKPMDTASFMHISKAMQFQDTVSHYTSVGHNGSYGKTARIYYRHKPIEFNGELFNGSIIVGDLETGQVDVEFLISSKYYKQTRMILSNMGLLMIEYSQNSEEKTMINFTLRNIYDHQL